MTEGAIIKALADSGDKLHNVSSLAVTLEVGANQVKKHFPLEGADRVVTGERGDGFTVVLIKGGHTSDAALVDTIWSSHAYQNRVDIEVKERNTIYIDLLAKRPAPLIQTQNLIRDRLVRIGEGKHIIKEKASAESFFSENKKEVKQEKKSGISQMFSKASANKITKEEPKAKLKSEVKTEEKTNMKNEQAAQIKKEKETPNEKMKLDAKEEIGGGKVSKSLDKHNEKQTTVTKDKPEKESVDVEMSEDSLDEDTISKGKSSSSPRGRRPSEKRKKSSPDVNPDNGDSDDEVTVSKNKKKKRRVAIESDSEDEQKPPTKPQPKTQEERKQSSAKTGGTKNAKDQTSRLSFKDATKASTKNIADVDGNDNRDSATSKKVKESQSENRRPDGKKRRRVLKDVTHTFKDEEGYLQTSITKEMVSETDSEPEEGSKNTAANKSKSAAKSVLAPKGQASLFAFFKKN